MSKQYKRLMDKELAQHRVAIDALKLELNLRQEREILGLPTLEQLAEQSEDD